MESRHGEGQTDKQGLYQRKGSDSGVNLIITFNITTLSDQAESLWRVSHTEKSPSSQLFNHHATLAPSS